MERWKEYFIYDATLNINAGNGTIYQNLSVKIDSDVDFEWVKSTYVATNDRIKIKIKDESLGRYLLKGTTDIKSIAGRNILPIGLSNSFLPFIWPKPYTVSAGSNLTFEATDYSGQANTMRFALHGYKIREGKAPWTAVRPDAIRVPFTCSFSNGPVTIAANSSGLQQIELDIDSHFIVHKICGIRTGEVLIKLGESYRNRDWMNSSVHMDNVAGNGSFPNILPAPRFVPRGSVITCNMQDLSGAANTIDLTLIGEKIYG